VVLALVSVVAFLAFFPHDRLRLQAAAYFYVDSGLAAIELPRYREYLQQSTDSDAIQRLAQMERATGPEAGRPVDAAAAIELLQGDHAFERNLRDGKIIQSSEPGYPDWQRNRQQFDQIEGSVLRQRFAVTTQAWHQPWRLVTYQFLHRGPADWLTNLAVLLVVAPLAEAAAGPVLFLLCFVGAGAAVGAVHLLLSGAPMIGEWGALAALAGLLGSLFGARRIPSKLLFTNRPIALPGYAALLVLLAVEALRWALASRSAVSVSVDLTGLAFGAVMVGAFKLRDSRRARNLIAAPGAADSDSPRVSVLAQEAREAATRLDTRRAANLYKELVDLEPQHLEHLCAYLNVALLCPDEATLQDAALKLLWLRARSHAGEMRTAFLQLTQPKVLNVLPIDEHLRLARRLVRMREDAAALRVLDAILSDDHLRQLYGRQLADCLLGIYTGYVRRRLTKLAETIHSRLATYFEAPDHLGGVPPANRPPTTLFTSTARPRHTR